MNLLQMSFFGAVIIVTVMLIRTAVYDRLPKRTFLVLWSIVLFRLLVPVEISSELSVYSLLNYDFGMVSGADMGIVPDSPDELRDSGQLTYDAKNYTGVSDAEIRNPESDLSAGAASPSGMADILWKHKWLLIWGAGTFICAVYFAVVYVKCRREFSMSLPVCNRFVEQWMEERRMSRKSILIRQLVQRIDVRVSDRIDTPLTYGILRPVILLPKNMDWENKERISYILWHEYIHICHCDTVRKLLATIAACVHWFNLPVWFMYYIMGRDIELACDESVIKKKGIKRKSAYANVLIDMEAGRSGIYPLCNNFSRNAIEGRIRAIMKVKKFSVGTIILAAGLVSVVMLLFTTSSADGCAESMRFTVYDKDFDREEYDKLRVFCFDGYEDMSVSEYRNLVLSMTGEEHRELLERFYGYEEMNKNRGSDDLSFFICHVLRPLTRENWRENEFYENNLQNGSNTESEKQQGIVHGMSLHIMNENELTVGEYVSACRTVSDVLHSVMEGKTEQQLANEEYMKNELGQKARLIKEKLNTYKLSVDVNVIYCSDNLEGLPCCSAAVETGGVLTVYSKDNDYKKISYWSLKRKYDGL